MLEFVKEILAIILLVSMIVTFIRLMSEVWAKRKLKQEYIDGILCTVQNNEELIELVSKLSCDFIEKVYYDKQNNVRIETKWGYHIAILKEGRLYLDLPEKNWNVKDVDILIERNTLYKCILNTMENNSLVDVIAYYNKWKKYIQLYKWGSKIVLCSMVLLIAILLYEDYGGLIKVVKTSSIAGYPDYTYEEVLNYCYDKEHKWRQFVAENRKKIVEYQGISKKEGNPEIQMQFTVTSEEDKYLIEVTYMEIDGEACNEFEKSIMLLAMFEAYSQKLKDSETSNKKLFADDIEKESALDTILDAAFESNNAESMEQGEVQTELTEEQQQDTQDIAVDEEQLQEFIELICSYSDPPSECSEEELQEYFKREYIEWKNGKGDSKIYVGEDGHLKLEPSAEMLQGTWWDTTSQRCYMDIQYKDDKYYIDINWSSGASENTHWSFVGEYSYEFDAIYCEGNCVEETYTEDSGYQENYVYTNGTSIIYLDTDSKLYWHDYVQNQGEGCVFEKG